MPEFRGLARLTALSGAPGSPLQGQIYYDTGLGQLRYYDGSGWDAVVCAEDTSTISGAKTFTARMVTAASVAGAAGLNIPHGTAPSSPVNGDVWTESAVSGLQVRVNGTTRTLISSVQGSMTALININSSTATQTIQMGYGATISGATKTIAIGANGVSGSITAITLGSAVAGATSTTTVSGLLATAATATGSAGFRLPHGTAPSSPVNGDMWTTTAGLYIRINGTTVGPLNTGGPATTVTTLTGLQSAVVGTSLLYARQDHQHAVAGVVDTSTTQTVGGAKTFSSTLAASGAVQVNGATTTNPLQVKVDTDSQLRVANTGATVTVAGTSLSGAAYQPLKLDGTTLDLATGGSSRIAIASDGATAMAVPKLGIGTGSSAAAFIAGSNISASVQPVAEVYKDIGSGGDALLTIRGGIGSGGVARNVGIVFKMSSEADTNESNKAWSISTYTTIAWAGNPSFIVRSGYLNKNLITIDGGNGNITLDDDLYVTGLASVTGSLSVGGDDVTGAWTSGTLTTSNVSGLTGTIRYKKVGNRLKIRVHISAGTATAAAAIGFNLPTGTAHGTGRQMIASHGTAQAFYINASGTAFTSYGAFAAGQNLAGYTAQGEIELA